MSSGYFFGKDDLLILIFLEWVGKGGNIEGKIL